MTPNRIDVPRAGARDTRFRWLTLVLSPVLATLLLATDLGVTPANPAIAAIPAEAGPCVAGWREMPVPDAAFVSTPYEVVTRAGKPGWILGGTGKGLLALKWTGSRWKQLGPFGNGHRGLGGGVALSATKVLAVGYVRPLKKGRGALEPISGRIVYNSWKPRGIANPPSRRVTLTDVVAQPHGKAWAVGTRVQGGKLRAYAIRWNGKRWVRKDPGSGPGAGLLAVDRAPGGAIWIGGWRDKSRGRQRPLLARRTSKGWKVTRGATLPAGSAVVTDIAFQAANDGWATGYLVRSGSSRHEVFLEHWNGKSWKLKSLPWAADFAAIPRTIAVSDDGQIWIGGAQLANNNHEGRGFIAHFENGNWDISVLGVPSDVSSQVMDIGVTSWGAVASANVGASLLVLRTCQVAAAAASGRRRINVGNMAARRAAEEVDAVHGSTDDSFDQVMTALADQSTSAVTQALAAPVRSRRFVVRDMAAAAGIAESTRTYLGFAADLNHDGWKDVFFSRHGGVLPRLALGGPSGFKYAPVNEFTPIDRHGCAAADVNHDGTADILCAIGGARGRTLARHELALSVTTSDRALAGDSLGIADPTMRGRRVAFLRLNRDAYPEVFIINSPDRDDGLPASNRFFRNKNGHFVPAPGVGLDTAQGGACLLTGDFDQDGRQDLAYCVQYPIKGKPGLRFMRNVKGRLRDRTAARDIKPMGDIAAAFVDVTGDRHKDLIQLSPTRLRVSKWTASGYRKIYETKLTNAIAMATGDVNGDHRADIYIVRGRSRENVPDRLLVGKKRGRKWTSIKIPQTKQGIGDDVIALDYDKNGLADFLVLNGHRAGPGPVQLLASFRR